MEIKTAKQILIEKDCLQLPDRIISTNEERFIEAMQVYAKQFIELAADKDLIEYADYKVWRDSFNDKNSDWEITNNGISFRPNKKSILDIKKLIK